MSRVRKISIENVRKVSLEIKNNIVETLPKIKFSKTNFNPWNFSRELNFVLYQVMQILIEILYFFLKVDLICRDSL